MKRIDTLPALPSRPSDGHKGTFGRVLIIAGSRGMSGAACLSATAALRGGSGLVYVAVPAGIQPVVASFEPSYLTIALADDEDGRIDPSALATLMKHSQGMDAIAVGPGLGQSAGLRLLVQELYRALDAPLVIDADALNLLSPPAGRLREHCGPRILTPHVGEFARLTGLSISEVQSAREEHAARLGQENEVTIVLKGPGTLITDGLHVAVNPTGNCGMATGGTGDVLTGLIASLAGQGMSCFEAAQLGTHLHGTAGDLAAQSLGVRSMMASDLLQMIPQAWQHAESLSG